MKEQVKTMFEDITMPQDTEKEILQAMDQKQAKSQRHLGRRIAVLAAMLVLVLALSPEVRAAVKEWVEVLVFEDGITLYRVEGEEEKTIVAYQTEEPAWAEIRGDRLYFLGHGQEIDITDQIAEEEPYLYTYTDENGYQHFMVVGYYGELANFGIHEFIKNPDGTWLTGAGRNFLSTENDGRRYPWVDIIWEQLNIPWPKPGEDSEYTVNMTKNTEGDLRAIEIEKE